MKNMNLKYLFTILFCSTGQLIFAQNALVVPMDSVSNYENKTVTVCGKVQSAKEIDSENKGKIIFLNFGKPYPDQTFTVTIFEKNYENFAYKIIETLVDKDICVTGKVKINKEKPGIIANNDKQIEIKK